MKQSLWYKACNFSDSKKRVHLRLGPQTNSIGNSRDKRSSTKTISFKCILVFVSADFHTFSDSSEKNLLERRQIAWKNVTRLKFHHLPHIIEITNDTIKYVIAHADYPGKEYQFGKEIAESELLWPVDRVQKSLNSELQKINGADFFIFGHMMFDNIQTFANQIYIDTGSPKSGRLSFYKIK